MFLQKQCNTVSSLNVSNRENLTLKNHSAKIIPIKANLTQHLHRTDLTIVYFADQLLPILFVLYYINTLLHQTGFRIL